MEWPVSLVIAGCLMLSMLVELAGELVTVYIRRGRK